MERVDYEKVVIRELLDLYDRGELDISPWYQRRSVWTRPQKAYLVNSIFEGKPIPTLYIRHYLNIETEKSVRELVDGQQRVRAITEYVRGDFATRHPGHRSRVSYSGLSPTERRKFLMTSLSVGYLIEADDTDVIEIFGRLNSVAKTLNTQEKLNARYSGEFKQFCLKVAADHVQLWRDLRVFTANDIARMVEVQFVADLALNLVNGLSDFRASSIDRLYKDYDEEFPQWEQLEQRIGMVLGRIAEMHPRTIRDTIFSRSPLFFSLLLVLDSVGPDVDRVILERTLHTVDESFNSDVPVGERSEADTEFYMACTATTQRIRSRTVRDQYLREALKRAR